MVYHNVIVNGMVYKWIYAYADTEYFNVNKLYEKG